MLHGLNDSALSPSSTLHKFQLTVYGSASRWSCRERVSLRTLYARISTRSMSIRTGMHGGAQTLMTLA